MHFQILRNFQMLKHFRILEHFHIPNNFLHEISLIPFLYIHPVHHFLHLKGHQAMSQQQMQVAMSLLQDVEDEAKTIPEGSPSSKDNALALINGDLRLASQQAASLSERDSAFIRSMCLISEARLRCRFVAEPEGKQRKKELTTATQLIGQAIAIHDTPDKYSLLGAIHTDLGNWDQARAAYTKASTSDDAASATEARKSTRRCVSHSLSRAPSQSSTMPSGPTVIGRTAIQAMWPEWKTEPSSVPLTKPMPDRPTTGATRQRCASR